jgi:hypothetical protein
VRTRDVSGFSEESWYNSCKIVFVSLQLNFYEEAKLDFARAPIMKCILFQNVTPCIAIEI